MNTNVRAAARPFLTLSLRVFDQLRVVFLSFLGPRLDTKCAMKQQRDIHLVRRRARCFIDLRGREKEAIGRE